MKGACTKPVSWLKLEMYNLNELDSADAESVERHLSSCQECFSKLDYIRSDERRLKPLETAPAMGGKITIFSFDRRAIKRTALAATPMLAIAALLLLVIIPGTGHRSAHNHDGASSYFPGSLIHVKGGDLAMALIRERQGTVVNAPKDFEPGDRFMLRVTCPFNEGLYWDLAIFQGDEIYFPLHPSNPLTCGNLVPLQGAFTLDGEEKAEVCLFTDFDLVDRSVILDQGPETEQYRVVCESLEPGKN
ncbi:MAG: hypothetical protein GXP49_10615 [Deltaproteobacteria bacterium]|nr:hypothetical protein [Deltaproteobacteria bacterium]